MFYLILLLFLLVCGGLAVLTIWNFSTQVHVDLFFWQSPALPIGMWILISFFLGALLLYLVSVVSAWSDKRLIKKLQQQIASLEQQVEASKATPPTSSSPMNVPENTYNPIMPMPGNISQSGNLRNTPQSGNLRNTSQSGNLLPPKDSR
ncbi:hypothetical protein KDW_33210 [Dictyobacter vulcani]|uniref:Lipopolysaccharide assembly protein A domain-containing protein n=1 Tax=Dictyobacter vulcani TaxID=2607529 RepID=A0A5J4KSS6_9CHLR|nr:LapA family protein [Dictyobacter vulcani]GER89159.1 hypothetical protein KDW_33210 [Dictyobacter vulcani]